ncbi:MAG TPA: precorrin-3B C(17)-methyltransferase [Verrucomicrobiae bacterium]|nr:precorrin-3B C(17)-methyltransferase [Verrucomicrobiae bacterium]
MKPAVIILGPSALATGERAARAIDGELHGFAPRVPGCAVSFAEVGVHLRQLFAEGRPIIGLCAAGVLIRSLAPLLTDKTREPPVLALAEDGSTAVPLLGGHHGANELARRLAEALGGQAAVTTAGDLRHGVALDTPPPGWRLGNPEAAKAIMAALLAGETVALENETSVPSDWLSGLSLADEAARRIIVTERRRATTDGLLFHPATVVLGVGCERLAPAEELIVLAEEALAEAGLSSLSLACIASIDLKAAEPAVHALARHFGVPARFFDAARLEAEAPRLATPSDLVFRETGCHGVAEGAALAAVGEAGRLVLPKRRGKRSTAAIALAPGILDPMRIGQPRGRLAIVGIGPGSAEGRTAAAGAALRAATDWVGYRLYLDLLEPLATGKTLHEFDLGAEEKRVVHALDIAAQGGNVALISSGDAGIYAMATLVFELIERRGRADWARIEIEGVPGVSAMQAAAARAGAPLGHDFCAISLSDLLTPWSAIERRLKAAAEADFVVALYNPVSLRRRHQLAAARAILLQARPPETPVVLGRNLGRPEESLKVTTLAALDTEAVDMLTVVLIGASTTRRVARPDGGDWVYTPRGYAGKNAEKGEEGAA